jgi:hypothetical protein
MLPAAFSFIPCQDECSCAQYCELVERDKLFAKMRRSIGNAGISETRIAFGSQECLERA